MKIVFVEGYMNNRVRRLLAQAFGGQEYRMVGYMQEGGWWSQAAYVGDEELDSDALRCIQLDVVNDFGVSPGNGVFDTPNYYIAFDPCLLVHIKDVEQGRNNWGKPFEIVAWCVGGSDENVDDVYEA